MTDDRLPATLKPAAPGPELRARVLDAANARLRGANETDRRTDFAWRFAFGVALVLQIGAGLAESQIARSLCDRIGVERFSLPNTLQGLPLEGVEP